MQSATQSAVNQKDWIQQINIYTNMYQTLFKRNEVVKRSAGSFFSKVEETNQKHQEESLVINLENITSEIRKSI